MFKRLAFRKKENICNSINQKLDKIIELLEQQQQKGGNEKNFHFDHVQIEHLENIIFRLDNIEIDELSGKMIIGNNINAANDVVEPFTQKIDKKKVKKEARSDRNSDHQEHFTQTPKGFRFRNDP
jgi:hypothetical protein